MHQTSRFTTLESWLPISDRQRPQVRRLPRPELLLLEDRLAPAVFGAGDGLIANYFSDANLANLALTRIDPGVNVNWGTAAPDAALPAGNYSVRWTGRVQAQYTEQYTFTVASSGGVRLKVNGQTLVDHWTDHAATQDSGTISLQAGQTYDIVLEYRDGTNPAAAQLLWSSPSTPKAVIPTSQLYADGGWLDADLGNPAVGGSVRSTGSTFTVQGNGSFGGTADQGHFVYQSLPTAGTVIAQMTNTGGEAGLVAGDGLGAGAVYGGLFLTSNGLSFEYRGVPGQAAVTSVQAGVKAPTWLKILRDGNFLAAYTSATGADDTWTLVGTATLPFGHTVEVGIASAGATAGTFQNVSVTPIIPVGVNLNSVYDWSLCNAFVDMIKQAREFYSVSRSVSSLTPATVDANGWASEDFFVILQSGFTNSAKVYNGTYKLSFTGKATLSPWITPGGQVLNQVYDAATNTTTADVVLNAKDSDDGWYFGLSFTNTGSAVRDLRLIRPGYDPVNPPTFTREFLQQVEAFTTLRYQGFTRAINNTTVNWSDRARATDASQASDKGAAWEYVIQLANESRKDLWINVPVNATDDYVRQLATLLRDKLAPDRIVYVEYSNELWNGIFADMQNNRKAAVAAVAAGLASGRPSELMYAGETAKNADGTWVHQWDWAYRHAARQVKREGDIFAEVFGANALNGRIRMVLAGQMVNPVHVEIGLEFLNRTYGSPANYLYAISGAPYSYLGDADQRTNLTATDVLNALSANLDDNAQFVRNFAALASSYGVKLVAYEGGPDTFGGNNVAAKKAAALDPRMKDLVAKSLNQWFSLGGDLYLWFLAGPTNYDSPFGTWGMSNDVTHVNPPKLQGINAVTSAPPVALSAGFAVPGDLPATQYAGNPVPSDPYVRYKQNGATLDYLVRAPADGRYELRINYAAATAGGKLQVVVNGQAVQTLDLPATGSGRDGQGAPNTFADSVPVVLNLREGLNGIRLQVVAAGYTINTLKFAGVASSQPASPTPSQPATKPATKPVNAAPTIATHARVTSGPVSGTTVALSVLGADDAGESALTYTWTTIGTPPAAVEFSANGTNAARATTVTFRKAGTYSFKVTTRDAGGLTAESTVDVMVSATATALSVSPATATLPAGGTLQLAATVRDQFGDSMAMPTGLTWAVSGTGAIGSVSPTGQYTASATGGTNVLVRATLNGLSAAAAIAVGQATAPTQPTNVSSGFGYGAGFTSTGLSLNGYAGVRNSRLRLTNGGFQRSSSFFQTPVGVSRFTSQFTFRPDANGEGLAFVLQGVGPTALGAGGGGLGYTGIDRSVAVKFDVNGNAGVGRNSVGLVVNGNTPLGPALDLTAAGIDLKSGHEFHALLCYDNGTLMLILTNTTTSRAATLSTAVDIPTTVGGSAAYAGFTAASSGPYSTQEVLTWTFATVPAGVPMRKIGRRR